MALSSWVVVFLSDWEGKFRRVESVDLPAETPNDIAPSRKTVPERGGERVVE